ncbi:MAG: hypothetical protein ACE366_19850, partial [Bradymonadia bacterium]
FARFVLLMPSNYPGHPGVFQAPNVSNAWGDTHHEARLTQVMHTTGIRFFCCDGFFRTFSRTPGATKKN